MNSVVFVFLYFFFGGSNSCSDSCEGGKFMSGERRGKDGIRWENVTIR